MVIWNDKNYSNIGLRQNQKGFIEQKIKDITKWLYIMLEDT